MNKMIKDLINEMKQNPLLTNCNINEDNFKEFYEFHYQNMNCKNCTGLANCGNKSKGYEPVLSYHRPAYKMCSLMKKENRSNVKPLFVSGQSLTAKLEDFNVSTPERKKCLKWATDFVQNFHNQEKALYLYGPFGTGKTYLLSAIANELSQRGIKSIVAFFPDLSRELKSSINTNNLEELVLELKTIDCLMLDDFGGEMSSGWLRDEIIAPIFQHRLTEGKPTFISSNLDYSEIVNHLASSKLGTDQLKAGRIVERIKACTILVTLDKKVNK
ncbi:MAG: ATP-binding protein [bacterium]